MVNREQEVIDRVENERVNVSDRAIERHVQY